MCLRLPHFPSDSPHKNANEKIKLKQRSQNSETILFTKQAYCNSPLKFIPDPNRSRGVQNLLYFIFLQTGLMEREKKRERGIGKRK